MPTYEFKCQKCDKKFQRFLPVSAVFNISMDKRVDVPCDCGSFKVELLISGGNGFILNGSGFYRNDYQKKGV